ncbi:8-oxo-dGTP diphosphatase [Pararobbsia alpina]|uniref:NUDIX hydrolase n=1 Tax=Pararobbsia alpina TaxID=621374 RepID=UPI0039A40212
MRERATIVCWRDDKVLLVARTRGRWALPGGTIKRAESPVEAASREFEEETGLCGHFFQHLFQFGGLAKRHHVFEALIPDGVEPSPRNEIARCRWFRVGKVATLAASVPTRQIVNLAIGHKNVTIQFSTDHR